MPILSTRGAASAGGFGFSLKPPSSRVYATWNPSDKGPNVVLSNGNLTVGSSLNSDEMVRATLSKSAGIWYWEQTVTASAIFNIVGIANSSAVVASEYLGHTTNGIGYAPGSNTIYCGGALASTGITVPTGGVIGIELNFTTSTITWTYSGGTIYSTTFSAAGLSGSTFFPACTVDLTTGSLTANFGATAFSFTVPTGANAGVY